MEYEYIDVDLEREAFFKQQAMEAEWAALIAEVSAQQHADALKSKLDMGGLEAIAADQKREARALRARATKMHKLAGTKLKDVAADLLNRITEQIRQREAQHLHSTEGLKRDEVPFYGDERSITLLEHGIHALKVKRDELVKEVDV